MKRPICSRKWQVEAARDGRLRGKDLDRALRHRATCAECAEEERALAALGQGIAGLPEVDRDPLTARRSRQQLIAALNETVLDPPRPWSLRRAALATSLGLIAAAGIWFRLGRPAASSESAEEFRSVIEVHAETGARWSGHTDREFDRVDLTQGTASFTVHPHQGRRVIVRLPDGELEDEGTVFKVRVNEQRTEHIAVSEGRIVIRLRGRPDFSLGAGDAWQAETPVAAAASATEPERTSAAVPDTESVAASSGGASNASSSNPSAVPRLHTSPSAPTKPTAQKSTEHDFSHTDPLTARAEDDAYLHIVELLRQTKYAEARLGAKSYLLRFPNGFRRVEVLNIATRAVGAGEDPGAR